MVVTISALYEAVNKKEFQCIAGAKGIDNVVSWVHMVENNEIASFLKGNELIFVTGIGLKGDDELIELARRAYLQSISGLVINLGPYISEVPKQLVEFCDQNDLPLFVVPWHVHMADIMRDFAYLLSAQQQESKKNEEAFKQAILKPQHKDAYLDILGSQEKFKYGDFVVGVISHNLSPKELRALRHDMHLFYGERDGELVNTKIEDHYAFLVSQVTHKEICRMMESFTKQLDSKKHWRSLVYVGFGEAVDTLEQLASSYEKALSSIKVGKANQRNVMSYEDMGIYQMIVEIKDHRFLKNFVQSHLEPIIRYDLAKDAGIMEILKLYVRYEGSIMAIAEASNIHRNTVIYKIKKAEELMGLKFSDWSTRNLLDMIFKVDKLI